jgi:acyl-CoA thioesterase
MSVAADDASPSDTPVRQAQAAVRSLYANDAASQSLGIEIVEAARGSVRIEMIVRPDMANGHGMCHGGIVFAFADSAFAFACNSHGEPMVAAGASIEFVAPTPTGERLTATAVETLRTERHGIYDVVVSRASGEVVAHFRGRCSRLRTAQNSVNKGSR